MLKALTAAAAITVCCLGNEYPAKSQVYVGVPYGQAWQTERMQQQLNDQRNQLEQQQRQLNCRPDRYCS